MYSLKMTIPIFVGASFQVSTPIATKIIQVSSEVACMDSNLPVDIIETLNAHVIYWTYKLRDCIIVITTSH